MRASRPTVTATFTGPCIVVVCPAADAASLPDRALNAVTAHGEPADGLVPHFLTRTRWSRKVINYRYGRAVGAPIRLLSLDAMRSAAAAAAGAQWRLWQQVVAGTRPAAPFWCYAERHRADPDRHPLHRMQAEYRAQPRILAMTAYNALPGKPCPLPTAALEQLQNGYLTHVNVAWLAAVPAAGLVTADGDYLTAASQRLADRLAYLDAANAHLAALTGDTVLVAVAAAG
ncbi:hypothetical protein AB0F81_50340 [Actinoplanes sp. NPDC024001]|uniref:hypothetical protein n=1 Tax=Actinoplanes sp. NPDC024001 TaxID=3154598 RepID=UPI0033FF617D